MFPSCLCYYYFLSRRSAVLLLFQQILIVFQQIFQFILIEEFGTLAINKNKVESG